MPMLSSGERLHRQQLECSPDTQPQRQQQGPALRPDVPKKTVGSVESLILWAGDITISSHTVLRGPPGLLWWKNSEPCFSGGEA